jgi:hypothetical protein
MTPRRRGGCNDLADFRCRSAAKVPKLGTKRWKNFAKWANREFTPVDAEEAARLDLLSNAEWDQMKNPYLFSLRIAHRMLQIDKAANVAALNALTKEEAGELFDHLAVCGERFKCFADLANEAIERLLCAAAKIELERTEAGK